MNEDAKLISLLPDQLKAYALEIRRFGSLKSDDEIHNFAQNAPDVDVEQLLHFVRLMHEKYPDIDEFILQHPISENIALQYLYFMGHLLATVDSYGRIKY